MMMMLKLSPDVAPLTLFRFTFAEFLYAVLLVSDDLSTEQLLRCSDAERILAKRRETLTMAAAAAAPTPSSSSSSSSAAASSSSKPSGVAAAETAAAIDDFMEQDAPRSSRLLLFVKVQANSLTHAHLHHPPPSPQGIIEPAGEQLARKPLLP